MLARYSLPPSNVLIIQHCQWSRKEGNVLFNDALNTFYLRSHGVRHMVKDHLDREETCCQHMGYSFQLAARVLLYAPSHRQDITYHGLCYTSRGALAGMRNSSSQWSNSKWTRQLELCIDWPRPVTKPLSMSGLHKFKI